MCKALCVVAADRALCTTLPSTQPCKGQTAPTQPCDARRNDAELSCRRVFRKARHVALFVLWLSLKNAFHARRPWKMLVGQFKKWCGCHDKLHFNVTKATKSVTWMSPDIARPWIRFHSNTVDTKSDTPGFSFCKFFCDSLSLSLLLVCESSYFFSRLLFAFKLSWCLNSPQLGSFSTKLP